MTRLYALIFAAAVLLNACATAGPIAIKCGLQDIEIAAADYTQIKTDVQTKNWADLAREAEKIGWATLDCVLGVQARENPELRDNIHEFRSQHAVEFRAAGASAE